MSRNTRIDTTGAALRARSVRCAWCGYSRCAVVGAPRPRARTTRARGAASGVTVR